MKDTASGTFSFFRFTILVLLLFSYIPLTLIAGTGAVASSLSGAGPRGTAVSNAASLTNCRVTSSTPGGDSLVFLQHALSTLVIEVSDKGLVTAKCQASFPDEGKATQTLFQMSGNKSGNYLKGTYTFDSKVSGSWIGSYRENGNFKSEDVTVKAGVVTVHFTGTDAYLIDIDGKKMGTSDPAGSFDAVFNPVGFNSTKATAKTNTDQFSVDTPADNPPDTSAYHSGAEITKDMESARKLRAAQERSAEFHNPFCFIATAAYGSQTAPQLDTLRAFRDKVLMQSESGTWFVETYYYLSPPLADFIADKDALRWIVRFELLDPIVFILKNSQKVWNN